MILVVDDEAGYREVLAKMLTKAGYRVVTAADGNEALTLLENSHFDLIITDVFMPNLNGYALAARIRAKDPNVPIILISVIFPTTPGKIFSEVLLSISRNR